MNSTLYIIKNIASQNENNPGFRKEYNMGKIILITGPSGSGKSTLARIFEEKCGVKEIVSYTTRSPRDNEIDGVHYHFVSEEKFKMTLMVETIKYDGNFYGTSVKGIEEALSSDKACCIVADYEGCRKLKEFCGKDNVYQVFIYAELPVLKKRMLDRGDSKEKRKRRLELYNRDMQALKESDYRILNHGMLSTIETTARLIVKKVSAI